MKTVLHSLIALLIGLGAVQAQEAAHVPEVGKFDEYLESGMEVAGVRAPYYDDEGELRAQLYGGKAKVLAGGVADVSNLRIDVYQDGVLMMTVFAPQCFTKIEDVDGNNVLMVYSEGDVLIDMDQMTVTGRGFNFSSEKNQFEILHNSKVLVKESARGMQGVEL
ncbi:hypothetical protein P4E94_07570 [Pontiellaceae bacterium B12219]|nr:hypothetical protein [Pontiellaceae bacterium B12219]